MALRYRFDRFELSADEMVLYEDGQPAALGSRALDVLLALVQRPATLVSKSDLLDRVWPGLVVEENNLQVHVSSLRKVIGAKAIATVPGRGYRFVLPVSLVGGPTTTGVAGLRQVPPDEPSRSSAPEAGARMPLPALASTVWGREQDLELLSSQDPDRLTTLLGSGGVGKTTLALQVAHVWQARCRDGAVWVPLAQLSDPGLVVSAVAQALCLPQSDHDPQAALLLALESMELLLVLDNAEHLLQSVTELVRAILAQAPGVRVLVTSQSPLKLHGEREFRLHGLSVPGDQEPLDQARRHGAVLMFADEAHAADRRFVLSDDNLPGVIELCRRLDGLPLAIKLAAARMPLLGLQGTIDRLHERFRLLGATRHASLPARQQTLLNALDWSHELLTPSEQRVFRRLSVFAGGFSLNMAAAVARDEQLDDWAVIDVLGALVDHSLVSVDAADPPRYHLPESAHEYAAMKLRDSQEAESIRRLHAQAVTEMMEYCYEDYWVMADEPWLARYGGELDNVRQALIWAHEHDPALGVQLCGASALLYLLLGLAPECRRQAQMLEGQLSSTMVPALLGRYWVERSRLYWGMDNARMREFAQHGVSILRELGDARGLYLALRCLAGSGALDSAQAQAVLDEMGRIEQAHWPTRLRLQRLLARVAMLRAAGEWAQAQDVCMVLLARAQAAGLPAVVSATLSYLAGTQLQQGLPDKALETCRQLLSTGCQRRNNFVIHALGISASAWLTLGDAAQARQCLLEFVRASRVRDWEWFALYQDLLPRLARAEGHPEVADRLASDEGQKLDPLSMCVLGLGVQVI